MVVGASWSRGIDILVEVEEGVLSWKSWEPGVGHVNMEMEHGGASEVVVVKVGGCSDVSTRGPNMVLLKLVEVKDIVGGIYWMHGGVCWWLTLVMYGLGTIFYLPSPIRDNIVSALYTKYENTPHYYLARCV